MQTTSFFIAAHSLGGIMTQRFLVDNPSYASALILMGSFLEEKLFTLLENGKHKISFPVPTLSLAAELDGLSRITR